MTNYPCPACGFLTFDSLPGSYDICEICNWEDDHVQLKHPNLIVGANKLSLMQAQTKILLTIPLSVTELKGYVRDPKWRPADLNDCTGQLPNNGLEYFHEAGQDNVPYYWLK